jgi:uncharacterized protein (TIGR02466 family)
MNSDNGNISKNKYILNDLVDLKADIIYHSELYFKNYLKIKKDINFYITNSWINNHKSGDYAQAHCHKNAIFSGVYYLKIPKDFYNAGDLSFEKGYFNNVGVAPSTFHFEYEEYNNINADTYKITPKDGMIIIFPSYLYHAVTLNSTKEDRLSLAFNFFAKGKIGKEEWELTI